jgi:hypothetical protein
MSWHNLSPLGICLSCVKACVPTVIVYRLCTQKWQYRESPKIKRPLFFCAVAAASGILNMDPEE